MPDGSTSPAEDLRDSLMSSHADMGDPELTILMPCLNEARSLVDCIRKAKSFLTRANIAGEILIADNGSTDGSQALARAHQARVIDVAERGYGSALLAGIAAARGRYVIMGDSDGSYDFAALEPFVARLREGAQLVMGNRFAGGIAPGAMPLLHRYLGNPVLSAIGRLLFASPCHDFHCGLRGFDRAAILSLDLASPGMEFASEMIAKASLRRLRFAEVPTSLSPDQRDRKPHLRAWRDGWRHLRFLLLLSPRGLFLAPGLLTFAIGLAAMVRLLAGPVTIGGMGFDIGTLLYASAATVIGWQSIIFWVCAKLHFTREGIVPPHWLFERALRHVTLERALLGSIALFAIGFSLAIGSLADWRAAHFGALDTARSMRLVIPAGTIMLLAAQSAYGAMFVALVSIRAARRTG
jgi:glycosyltransferase involved in cell wall biosynthesis